MYGLVLMTALSTAPTVPASDGLMPTPIVLSSCTGLSAGCTGCTGCTGVSYFASSCTGSSCYSSSCFGSSCHSTSCYSSGCYSSSCHGRGPLFPRIRALLSGRFGGCHSTSCYSSSCYSSSCHSSACYSSSCYGSSCHSSGCYSSSNRSGCYGSGCYSSSYGSGCYSSGPVYYGQASFAPSAPVVIGSSLYGDAMGNFSVASLPTIKIDRSETRATSAKPETAPARILQFLDAL